MCYPLCYPSPHVDQDPRYKQRTTKKKKIEGGREERGRDGDTGRHSKRHRENTQTKNKQREVGSHGESKPPALDLRIHEILMDPMSDLFSSPPRSWLKPHWSVMA